MPSLAGSLLQSLGFVAKKPALYLWNFKFEESIVTAIGPYLSRACIKASSSPGFIWTIFFITPLETPFLFKPLYWHFPYKV